MKETIQEQNDREDREFEDCYGKTFYEMWGDDIRKEEIMEEVEGAKTIIQPAYNRYWMKTENSIGIKLPHDINEADLQRFLFTDKKRIGESYSWELGHFVDKGYLYRSAFEDTTEKSFEFKLMVEQNKAIIERFIEKGI
jgi:hypothetical protein